MSKKNLDSSMSNPAAGTAERHISDVQRQESLLSPTHQPDVILMDINLPGISGIKALKILREDPSTAHIPVLAISANAMPHDIKKGLDVGFLDYLTKPIIVNEFMAAIDTALELVIKRSDGAESTGEL